MSVQPTSQAVVGSAGFIGRTHVDHIIEEEDAGESSASRATDMRQELT